MDSQSILSKDVFKEIIYQPKGQPNPGSANSQSMAAGIASRAIQISETALPNNSELINVLFEMETSLFDVFRSINEHQ